MNFYKIKLIGLAALSVVILQSCYKSTSETTSVNDRKAYPVAISSVGIDTMVKENYYIGTIEPIQTLSISFSIPGIVQNVNVSEGQFVGKGTVLAQLDNSTYLSSLKMSEAVEKQARDAYERLSKVYKEGSLPEIKYVDIQTKLQQAEATTEITRKNISDCIIKAPTSGVVGKRNVEPGTNAMPMTPAFTLCKIDEVLVKIPIPESEISKMRKGEKARIVVPALDNMEFNGTIEEIGVMANFISHTYDVKVRIRNSKNILKPGMVCNAYIDKTASNNGISVANNAVISENGKTFVYVVNPDKRTVSKKEVKTGRYSGNNIIINEGIQSGENIVVSGQQKLYDGAPIIVN